MEDFEKLEQRARRVRGRMVEMYMAGKLPQDAHELITAIDVNLEDLDKYQQEEYLNKPYAKKNKDAARHALGDATLIAEKTLHEQGQLQELTEEHTDLVRSAKCLIVYLQDMADELRAPLYFEVWKNRNNT